MIVSPSARHFAAAVIPVLVLHVFYVLDRIALVVTLPEVAKAIDLTSIEAATAASIFTLGIAVMAFGAGFLIRAFGLRRMMIAAAASFSLLTAYVPFASGYVDLIASRILLGAAEGVFLIALMQHLGSVSAQHRIAAIGLAPSVFGIASFVGPSLIHLLNSWAGDWRASFFILAAFGLIAVVPLFFMPRTAGEAAPARQGAPAVLAVLKQFWPLFALLASLGITSYSIQALLPTWTRAHFAFDPATSALVLGFAGLGAMLGGAPIGLLADRIPRRLWLVLTLVVASVSASLLMYASPSLAWSLVCSVLVGMAGNAAFVAAQALAIDTAGTDSPVVLGIMAGIFYGFAAVSGTALAASYKLFSGTIGAPVLYISVLLVALTLFLAFFKARFRAVEPHSVQL